MSTILRSALEAKREIEVLRAGCKGCAHGFWLDNLAKILGDIAAESESESPVRATTQNMTVFLCGFCGERIRAKDRYCWSCGKEINWVHG